MVVFTCGHCGESVNKPKVEKHYLTKCRNRNPNLSCMDCFKDFFGKDYEAHNKCITEEQRYSAKGFVAKEKKGEQKQNAWVEMVQSVLDEQTSAPANVLRILNAVSKHTNTPRKKPKFINFVKNVCGHKSNPKDIDAAWEMISVKLSELSAKNQRNQKQEQSKEEQSPVENESIVENENEGSSSEIMPENGETEHSEDVGKHEKKSKKQLKEEKKRLKYESELHSAGQMADEEMEESEQKTKKEKKKKGETNGDVSEEVQEGTGKNKNKKRKRLDTANEIAAAIAVAKDNGADDPPQLENLRISEEKTKKKKPKVVEPENADESICLHDQNVARNEEEYSRPEMFNWHAVIVSLLSKKGNELPFKRLQKKVLGEYSEVTGQEVDDRIADKFIKKLRSAPNVKVDKNRVLLMD